MSRSQDTSGDPHQPWQSGLEWVRRASTLAATELSREELARRGLGLALQATTADFAAVDVLGPDGASLEPLATHEVPCESLGDFWPGWVQNAVRDKVSDTRLLDERVSDGERRFPKANSRLVAPLLAKDEVTGLITLGRSGPEPFSARDEAIISMLGVELGVALQNAGLFQTLQESEARFRQLVESSWDGTALIGPDGSLEALSGHFFASTGIPVLELQKRGWASIVHPDDVGRVSSALTVASGGSKMRVRFRYEDAHGQWGWAEAAMGPFERTEDEGAVLANVRDVTESRDQELRLRESEKLAAVGRLISGLTHDLSGPLTSVRGLAEAMVQDTDDQTLRSDLEIICREAASATHIVSELMGFVRRREPERRAVRICVLVNDVVRRNARRARSYGVTVSVECAEGVPVISGDPEQLGRIVRNLLRNAEDALLGSDVSDKAVRISTDASKGHVVIRVADNGPGISEEVADTLFEPLVSTKSEGSGTGFGLAIARDLARAHDGELSIEPSQRGAVFVLSLPITDPSDLEAADEPVEAQPSTPKRVLVVDDDAAIRRTLKRVLVRRGHSVEEAANADTALSFLLDEGRRYDRILIDNRMPGMTGRELFKRVSDVEDIRAHVIFITGDAVDPDTQAFIRDTGLPYVPKPFEVADLLAVIEQA